MKLKYIVTGTGGCGTKSVAVGFHNAGFVSTHEGVLGVTGIMPDIEKYHADVEIESSWMAAYHLPRMSRDIFIVHLIRDPEKATLSNYHRGLFTSPNAAGYALFAHNALQSLHNYSDPLDKTAHFIIEWNKMIEPYADLTHKIEDGVPALMDKLGIEFDPALDEWHHKSGKVHPRLERGQINDDLWWELLTQKVQYGY